MVENLKPKQRKPKQRKTTQNNAKQRKTTQNNAKQRKPKQRKTKRRKPKRCKMIGGVDPEPIVESDIMYQDDLVCILKPEIKKGIIIWTHYTQPSNLESLCVSGLKTGKQLQSEGVEFGRNKIHPYIFFRAPYFSRDINYSTPETEIISSFGENQIGIEPKVFIRVDPNKTFVFSSEIRAKLPDDIDNSKKTLSTYLEIIAQNAIIYPSLFPLTTTKKQAAYDLHTSKLVPISNNGINFKKIQYPLDDAPIERNSEILVSIPHLTPDFYVLCT
jgi:hypothetical protein